MRKAGIIATAGAVSMLATMAIAPGVAAADTAAICAGKTAYQVSVIDPAYGAELPSSATSVTVRVCAPGMLNLDARSWHAPDAAHPQAEGYDKRFANAQPDANGYAEFVFPAAEFPHGPGAVLIDAWDSPPGDLRSRTPTPPTCSCTTEPASRGTRVPPRARRPRRPARPSRTCRTSTIPSPSAARASGRSTPAASPTPPTARSSARASSATTTGWSIRSSSSTTSTCASVP